MSPPFELLFTNEALARLDALELDAKKLKRVRTTLGKLESQGPAYPGLNSHKYTSLSGPRGDDVWGSYVENRTPSAWCLFWVYGPDKGQITVLTFRPYLD